MSSAMPDVGGVTNWADEEVDESTALHLAAATDTEPAQPTSAPAAGLNQSFQPPFKAYISNISYAVQPDHIRDLFQGLQIKDLQTITHRDTGKPKGVFVEFATPDDLSNALQAEGTVVLGRPISVQVARPWEPAEAPRRPGGAFTSKRSGFSDYDTPRSRHGSNFEGQGHLDSSLSGGSDGSRSLRGRDSFPYDNRDGLGSRGSGRMGFDDRPSGPFDRRRGSGGTGDEAEGRWAGRGGPGAISRTTSVSSTRSTDPAEVDGDPARQRSLTVQIDRASSGQPKANPFGSAKPVDAAAKLKELDERDAKRKAEEAAARKAEREAGQAAERAQRDGAAGPPGDAPQGPPQRGWSRRGSRSGPDSLHAARSSSGDGAGPPPGLQSRGSQGRGRGRGDQRGPGGNWPGEARGAGYAQGNGQPHSALLNPPSGSGAPQMKRRPSKAESNSPAAGPSSVEAPTPGPPASEAASTAPAPSAAPSPSGGSKVDDDGFERQGRGPKQAWAGAAKGHQAPAAAQQNAWSQKSSSIRTPPAGSTSTEAEPPKLENAFAALNSGET